MCFAAGGWTTEDVEAELGGRGCWRVTAAQVRYSLGLSWTSHSFAIEDCNLLFPSK